MQNLTRKEKIELLAAIRDGLLTPEDLKPCRAYVISPKGTTPGIYEFQGKDYNEEEYQELVKRLSRKQRSIPQWLKDKFNIQDDMIITLRDKSQIRPRQ